MCHAAGLRVAVLVFVIAALAMSAFDKNCSGTKRAKCSALMRHVLARAGLFVVQQARSFWQVRCQHRGSWHQHVAQRFDRRIGEKRVT